MTCSFLRTWFSLQYDIFRQSYFIPAPPVTEKELPDLTGKVILITGGYGGVGFQTSKLLYGRNATVYIAGRSEASGAKAIEAIKSAYPFSAGRLEFLYLDLMDFDSVKECAEAFIKKEERLDFLNNNAGVLHILSKEEQENEMMKTNCLGPYLFTKLLTPILKHTANISPPNSVRVAWAASIVAEECSPRNGILFDDKNDVTHANILEYGQTKAGNFFFANAFGKQNPEIVSTAYNPGNLDTDLMRSYPHYLQVVGKWVFASPAIFGAYTTFYCAFSEELKTSNNGQYIIPWGRKKQIREDIALGLKEEKEGGTGALRKFITWCDKQIVKYL